MKREPVTDLLATELAARPVETLRAIRDALVQVGVGDVARGDQGGILARLMTAVDTAHSQLRDRRQLDYESRARASYNATWRGGGR